MRCLSRVAFVLVSLSLTATAFAQAQPKYTWIRHFQVERGREADFIRLQQESTRPMMERLVAEKKIAGWGVAVPLTMVRQDWTHIVYVALPDWSGAEALGNAMSAAEGGLSAADRKRMSELATSVRDGGVRDVVLRHLVQNEVPPAAAPQYILVDTYDIKPGRGGDAVALFNEWAKPLFSAEPVRARVPLWGLSIEDVPSGEPWTHMVWSFLADLGARDALDAAQGALDPMKLRGFDVRLRDMSHPEKHRAQILKIVLQ